jgi:hypothetical protein
MAGSVERSPAGPRQADPWNVAYSTIRKIGTATSAKNTPPAPKEGSAEEPYDSAILVQVLDGSVLAARAVNRT